MGTFIRKGEGQTTYPYEYTTDDVKVTGNYTLNATTGQAQGVSGSVYRETTVLGSFSGVDRGGGMRYTTSDMDCETGKIVYDCIEDIQRHIEPQEGGEA